MISTVTLSFDLTYVDPLTGALAPRGIVTDTTDYAGLGIDLNILAAKGLGEVTFNGDIIVPLGNLVAPNIDLQNWDYATNGNPNFTFPLELDLNGNVANGIYTLEYRLRLNTVPDPLNIIAIPTANTIVVDGATAWAADFLEQGNGITLLNGAPAQAPVFIDSVEFTDPNVVITTSTVVSSPLFQNIQFDITNVQFSGVFPYTGCTQVNADVSFVYDCEYGDNGTWAVANTTPLAANEIIAGLNCVVSYPSWTAVDPAFNPQVVLTSLPYPTLPDSTPLATGTYTVSLTEQIQQTQTSGLIVLYSKTVIKEFSVSCAGSLCGLSPCIENLRAAHQAELTRNKISKYQVFVDNVLMYYAEAMTYKACGELDKYRAAIACIQAQLDASGCECACCDNETYYWVSNNSANSVIQTLLDNFQYRLYDGGGADPGATQNGVQLGAIWQDVSTGILYRCIVDTPGFLVWEVYYAPGVAPNAIDVPADNTGHNFLTAGNVQLQLDQVDALAIFDGENGLTKNGNNLGLGGVLDTDTTIDVNGNDFIFTSDDATLEVIATAGAPLLLNVNQGFSGVGINAILTTTNTAGVGANGIGSSIQFVAENAAGTTSLTSTVRSTWVNAAASNSNFQITTKNANVESPALTLNFNGSATLNEYGQGNFPAAPEYLLGVNNAGLVVESLSAIFTMATIRISQTLAGAPTLVQTVYNNTGETFSFNYAAVGVYRIILGSVINTTKTGVLITNGNGGSRRGFVYAEPDAGGYVVIRTYDYDTGLLADGILNNATLEIKLFQ